MDRVKRSRRSSLKTRAASDDSSVSGSHGAERVGLEVRKVGHRYSGIYQMHCIALPPGSLSVPLSSQQESSHQTSWRKHSPASRMPAEQGCGSVLGEGASCQRNCSYSHGTRSQASWALQSRPRGLIHVREKERGWPLGVSYFPRNGAETDGGGALSPHSRGRFQKEDEGIPGPACHRKFVP